MEWITEDTQTSELRHQWTRTRRVAIKGPANLYRIEAHTSFGSYIQLSDGVNEWVYMVESNSYVKRPVPQNWPEFPKLMDPAMNELMRAWNQRTWLEEDALGYKRATMLPEETIVVEGRRYPCYVVHVSSDDSVSRHEKDVRWEMTFWIDKKELVFRRTRRISDGFTMMSKTVHLPFHGDTTDDYPVTDLNPRTTSEMFQFAPPVDAKQVATLEPDWGGPRPAEHPRAQMVGQPAPDVTFTGSDGKKIALYAYRGKPLLIDFWATWCGPCLLSMPAINRVYAEVKEKGLAVVSFDENNGVDDGPVYLARHNYSWTNFHDEDKAVQKSFKGEGIPLTVLIDGQGKIVYYDFGGDEAALRKAIASLGPAFASIAPHEETKPAAAPADASKHN